MRYIDLEAGDEVVLDVGHSGGVTGLAITDIAVVSGADDGFVYIRDREGSSLVPPPHLPAVTTITALTGTTYVVGTEGHTYGVEVTTGDHRPLAGLEDTSVAASAAQGERAVLGCVDGTVRTLAFGEGVHHLAKLGAPIKALVADEAAIVAATVDGRLTRLDASGGAMWEVQLRPGEVEVVAHIEGTVVVGGAGPVPATGQLIAFDDDGEESARLDVTAPVLAIASDADGVVVALGDDTVRRLGSDLTESSVLGRVTGLGVESLALTGGEVWYGTADGQVGRLDPPLDLPARSSGVIAMAFHSDGDIAIGTDGNTLRTFDLRSGEVSSTQDLPGVVGLSYADADGDDLVIAFLDGRLERRRSPEYTEVTAEGRVELRPSALGYLAGHIVAEDDGRYAAVTAGDLDDADLPDEWYEIATIARRTGFNFTGYGLVAGLDVAVIDGTELVVIRPGLLGVTDGAADIVRIWRDEVFLTIE